MKQFVVAIENNNVYINGELHHFAHLMDKADKEDDLNKKALLALATEMGYEAVYLFEEMVDTLSGGYKMKIEEEFTSTKNEPTAPDKFVVELDCVMFGSKEKPRKKGWLKRIFRRNSNG